MKQQFRHIGKESKRLPGDSIVTGKAMYTADHKLPGMQYGRILRSPHPYARIVSVDAEKARVLPGVSAVVIHSDVPRNIYVTNGFTPPQAPPHHG